MGGNDSSLAANLRDRPFRDSSMRAIFGALVVIAASPIFIAGNAGCRPGRETRKETGKAIPSNMTSVSDSDSDSPSASSKVVEASPIQLHERHLGANPQLAYQNGAEAGHASILESLGGGVAAFDFDGDGWLDLCF